ncbi:hypothetical protein NP945_31030 [Mesorhizobium sp. LMG17149]|jgi:hypothetical protein|uniref:hypothetical protein n=1 Tax=Mesorhizobium sp. LMG17149 TaxID=2968497 RepID=UPI002118B0F9|nr:hypothetical protein [Mesorhizobium sp. LMG17149]MCQ8876281.1 hypothetical protein [Mesorhizobium sp. LMG17149]
MVQTHLEVAQAVIATGCLVRHNSMIGTAKFRQDEDRSRRAIETSRELLKRLRQRHHDDMARGWEDPGVARVAVSAFDADILRSAFRELVRQTGVPEYQWRDLATSLVHEFTGCEQMETGLVDWITSK